MKPIRHVLKKLPGKLPQAVKSKKPMTPPPLALRSVTSKSGKGVYASSDTLFKGAVFGRDSLEVAEDLLRIKPRLVRHILTTLAHLQGLHSSDISEEEHGKIVHEYRTRLVDGKPLDEVSRHIFEELASRWGGNSDELAYYGSIDATPHFVRVLGRYCQIHGDQFLKTSIKRRDGRIESMADALLLAVDWLLGKLANSSSGLLEYRARNPEGIENQVWKDSREFYVHQNGELANHEKPIASIEVQGLAYDALVYAGQLLPERQDELRVRAEALRARTLELLWRPRHKYFALGIDHTDDGTIRPIETITANPAALLDSCIFDDLPANQQQMYIGGIVQNIMGSDFLTDAGIRSRSLSESKLVKFWDYHGSFTSWPKETYDVAKGLRRQSFPKLARELENRLINVVKASRGYPEFVYVDFRGRVLAGPPRAAVHGRLSVIDSTNKPEKVQAWTVSAVLAIATVPSPRLIPGAEWQLQMEEEILSHIPHVPALKSAKALAARYPDYPYQLQRPK
jgi:glycogen debranching enzyme